MLASIYQHHAAYPSIVCWQPGNCSMNNLEVKLLSNVVQMSYPNSSVCSASTAQFPGIDGTYAITQFHIHDSSEHKINGDYFAAELHMVFQLVNGTLNAVVALPIQPDSKTDNPVFSPILSAWKQSYLRVLEACNISTSGLDFSSSRRRFTVPSTRRNLQANASSSFSAYDLIPPGSTYYTYNGSLTTPPCTQGVWWSVLDTPMLVSVRQYEQLSMVLLGYRNTTTCQLASASSPSGSTGRPIQPLNGRTVVRVCPSMYTQLSSQAGGASSSAGAPSMGMLLWTRLIMLGLVQLVVVVVFVM